MKPIEARLRPGMDMSASRYRGRSASAVSQKASLKKLCDFDGVRGELRIVGAVVPDTDKNSLLSFSGAHAAHDHALRAGVQVTLGNRCSLKADNPLGRLFRTEAKPDGSSGHRRHRRPADCPWIKDRANAQAGKTPALDEQDRRCGQVTCERRNACASKPGSR
jgi:hypothetical protein